MKLLAQLLLVPEYICALTTPFIGFDPVSSTEVCFVPMLWSTRLQYTLIILQLEARKVLFHGSTLNRKSVENPKIGHMTKFSLQRVTMGQ